MSYGHGPLGQTLLEHNLLDEIHFAIHPTVSATKLSSRSPFSPTPRATSSGSACAACGPNVELGTAQRKVSAASRPER